MEGVGEFRRERRGPVDMGSEISLASSLSAYSSCTPPSLGGRSLPVPRDRATLRPITTMRALKVV